MIRKLLQHGDIPIGKDCQILPGLWQLRMPSPAPANHTDVFAIQGTSGWTIVDCGYDSLAGREIWLDFFGRQRCRKLERIVVTHHHPPQIGLAHWLAEISGAPVYMAKQEWHAAVTRWQDDPVTHKLNAGHYTKLGVAGIQLQQLCRSDYRRAVAKLPQGMRFLSAAQNIEISAKRYQVFAVPGHSIQHLCLYDSVDRVLLAGDQLNPVCAVNAVFNALSRPDPLGEYLGSIRRLASLPCSLVATSAAGSFANLAAILREVEARHTESLDRLCNAITEPLSVAECVALAFPKGPSAGGPRLALAQTAALLLHLVKLRRLRRFGSETWRFAPAG